MRPECQRSQGLAFSTCRQRSGWNHHTPGLRRLASLDFLQDRLHRCRGLARPCLKPFRDSQSIRRSPSLCLQHHDALTPHSKRHTALHLSQGTCQCESGPSFVPPTRSAIQSAGNRSAVRFLQSARLPVREVGSHQSSGTCFP
jgi:hypothetical protein